MNSTSCNCRKCLEQGKQIITSELPGPTLLTMPLWDGYEAPVFIACSQCGNKRCPHATDHVFECTNSNDPGQLGSIYG